MKIRNGYVSNSSSSSFIVLKDAITMEQRDMIVNFQDWAKFFKMVLFLAEIGAQTAVAAADQIRGEQAIAAIFAEGKRCTVV